MKKWIKLKSAFGKYKANDLIELDLAIADAYIEQGVAEDATKEVNDALKDFGAAGFGTALREFSGEMSKAVKEAVEEIRKEAGNRTRIEPVAGGAEADKKKNLGDFVCLVVKAGNYRDIDGMQAAQKALGEVYAAENRKGMTESEGANGGYWTVPEAFETMLMKQAAEDAVILPGSTQVPMGAKAVSWPALDQYQVPTEGNSAMFGGVTVSRKAETSKRDGSKPQAKKIKLECNDLTAYTQYSRDLDMDSTGTLSTMLVELIGGAIGWRRDYEHFNGSGAGQCLGVLKSPALIRIPRKAGGTISYQDPVKMLSRLTPDARKNAVWVAHPFLLENLMEIKDDSGRLIMMPTMTNSQGPLATASAEQMLNRPIFWSEKIGVPGADFDLILIDRRRYLVGQRAGIEIGLSEHFLFDTDEIAIRAKIRDDGQPSCLAPFYLADGSKTNQISPFVGLKAATN